MDNKLHHLDRSVPSNSGSLAIVSGHQSSFPDRLLIAVRTNDLPHRVAFDYSFGGATEKE